MKCPKCGYLGFESTDRCRNCGYDFSLAAPAPPAELTLRTPTAPEAPLVDFDLQDDALGSTRRDEPDHERAAAGFGQPEPRRAPLTGAIAATPVVPEPPPSHAEPALDQEDDLPLFAPRPAGTPLAVRRQGHEVPKSRRTSARPPRLQTAELPLVSEQPGTEAPTAGRPVAPDLASLGGRLLAAVVDFVLLGVLDVAVLGLTLRMAGLSLTWEDLWVIRPAPMAGFLLVMSFLYLTGFTVGGGQTIGKMLVGIRVTGDDGRGVDITGAVVRAIGCMAAVASLGLLFLPAVMGAERRAVHDRLAGTRVVIA